MTSCCTTPTRTTETRPGLTPGGESNTDSLTISKTHATRCFCFFFFSFFKFPSRDSFHLLPSCVGTAEENDLLQLFTQSFATLKLCLTATLCLTVPPAWRRSAWTVRGEAPQQVSKQCRSLSLPSSRLRCQPNVNWDHRAARLYRSLTSTKSDWWWSSVTYTISDSGQVSFLLH